MLGWWGPLAWGALAQQVAGVVLAVVAVVQEVDRPWEAVEGAEGAEFLAAKRLGRPGAVGV